MSLLIIGGVGLVAGSGYSYLKANSLPPEQAQKQKQKALIAAGIGVVIAGLGAKLAFDSLPSNMPSNMPLSEPIHVCPIHQLTTILAEGGNSTTAKTFKIFNETRGISCSNYLPWQDAFDRGGTDYIDGIRASNMQNATMWGIDTWERPYLAIKYLCNQTSQGAVALFQRYTGWGHQMVTGGHFEAEDCFPGLGQVLQYKRPDFFETVTRLFRNETVNATYELSSKTNLTSLISLLK